MPQRTTPSALPVAFIVIAGLLTGIHACQDPAGPPPTLEAGIVSFAYAGPAGSASFEADGRCYWSPGYPVADSSCALAMDRGDTLLIRATIDPRTIRWQQMNLRFPADGACDASAACEIALDYLNRGGVVTQSLRSVEADVTIAEETADRIRGTFTGLLYRVGGAAWDTLRISGGTFDVPVDP